MKRISAVCIALIMMFSVLGNIGSESSQATKKMKLNKVKVTVAVGRTAKLRVKQKGSARVTFKSTKKSVARVTKTGRVKGRKQGTAKVIAIVKGNRGTKKLSCKVTVVKKVTKIQALKDGAEVKSISLMKGTSVVLKASKKPASSKDTLVWSSSDKTIASVSKKGVVKGVSAGSAKIYVKAKATGKRVAVRVNVTRPPLSGSLKEVYAKYFDIGCALNVRQFMDSYTASLVQGQFSTMTMENEMKPDAILNSTAWKNTVAKGDENSLQIDTTALEKVLANAQKYGMKLRGHTLVWHSQTPYWIFYKGFEQKNGLVSADVMNARMESYIKQVMEYCQTKYPNQVVAWDVVNEAMSDGTGDADGYRNTGSLWYSVYKSGAFVEKAFEYANKYRAEGVKLFYNDYNEYNPIKMERIYKMAKALYEKGYLDGIGMQSHYSMDSPTVSLVETAIKKYASIGEKIEIQLTELDIHNTDNSAKGNNALTAKYKELFEMLVRLDKNNEANITNVTFWGLSDSDTWLTNFKGERSYPLLFNGDLTSKGCFDAIISVGKQN